ncbi:MAG: GTPase Era [Nitriliruptorales bacterium]|nr:GTPase Era [Nitriliruptorales bacterium]
MRSGLCALVGRPNVGKSTLLNAIVGQKVAITAAVPQTTRHAIRGVLHRDDLQIVFVDTPGMHKPKTLLGTRLNEVARGTLSGVDIIVFLIDGQAGVGRGDQFVASLLAEVDTPTIAVVNKVDAYGRPKVLPQLQRVAAMGEWAEVVPISAKAGDNVDTLVDLIAARMPDGPPYFPQGQITDQPQEQLFAELVREKAIRLMSEEVPHSITVAIEEIGPGESEGVVAVTATLYVERDSQKGIVIGKGGTVLREIGSRARQEMQAILGTRVYLDLRVKLFKEWQRDPKKLQRLGY